MDVHIGIIGGSGLYEIAGMKFIEERSVITPFGAPSAAFTIMEYEGRQVAFLPRHGKGHRFNPSNIPVQANIHGFKQLGVTHLLTISAVGSLQRIIEPRHFVIPDQIIDRTKNRVNTFFEDLAVHVAFADPYCPHLSRMLADASREVGVQTHEGGTYLCMEGPLFSTRAESRMYRSWGASVIGMTALPEAKLAREAEMHYATVACSTDYDCWFEEENVDIQMIIANLQANIDSVKELLKRVIPRVPVEGDWTCPCASALANAIITAPEAMPDGAKARYKVLAGKYFGKGRP